jgi:hypothetical protein
LPASAVDLDFSIHDGVLVTVLVFTREMVLETGS